MGKRRRVPIWAFVLAALVGPALAIGTSAAEAMNPTVDVFHYGAGEALNLAIGADGTFVWTLDGCDVIGGDEGRWEKESGGRLTLLPARGRDTFRWSDGRFVGRVHELHLVRSAMGVEVEGRMETGETLRQSWTRGCVCPVCATLGPERLEACSPSTGTRSSLCR